MLTIIDFEMVIEEHEPSSSELHQTAEELFRLVFAEVSRIFPPEEVSIGIFVESGSKKINLKVLLTVPGLIIAIGQYGEFKQGLREIVTDVSTVVELVQDKINADHPEAPILVTDRPTLTSRLEELFRRVERGELTPEEAAELALALLKGEPGFEEETLRREFLERFRKAALHREREPGFEPEEDGKKPPAGAAPPIPIRPTEAALPGIFGEPSGEEAVVIWKGVQQQDAKLRSFSVVKA